MPDDTAVLEPEIAEETKSEESKVETNADTTVSVTESELSEAQAKTLADILRRDKEATQNGVDLDLTDEELDLYDKYVEGKIQPAKEEKKEEKAEKTEKSEKSEKSELPKEIQDVMKLTGAKDEKDLAKKVKDLTNHIANKSKDVEYVSKLSQEHEKMQGLINSEVALWKGVKEGDPAALKWAEENHGVVPKKAAKKTFQSESEEEEGDYELSNDAFLDDETGKKLNAVIGKMTGTIKKLEDRLADTEGKLKESEDRFKKADEESLRSRANQEILTETLSMAREYEELKEMPELETKVDQFLSGKNDDAVFKDTIGKIFDEVKAARGRGEKISLRTAFKTLKADDADLLISKARSEGRKSAYEEHQPSKTLSEHQKGGEPSQFRNFTDEDIEEFAENPETIPDSFFDADFNPLPKEKIPKKAWRLFGYK